MSEAKSLYDEDFYLWSKQQAEALRSAGRGGSNQKLDWENLAEEIDSLGRSDRRELASRLGIIIQHLIKLADSLATDPRNDWRYTVTRERMAIERLIEDSPSLAGEVQELIGKEIRRAAKSAIADLERHGELPASIRRLRGKPRLEQFQYPAEQILGDWFPPEPQEQR